MKDKSLEIGKFVHDSMVAFGEDVNTQRQLPLYHDGLKPVYRRAIYTMLSQGTNMAKTASIVGKMIGTVHPHGDQSCEQPVSNLVRWGIAAGQGNHGGKMLIGEDADRSAPRYTEARVSDKYLNIFKDLMSYVPYDPAELPGFEEPRYLPTPVPLCLTFGSLGIGIGVNSRIPAFTVTSMMRALMNDDPQLLEAPFGLKIIKEESELDLLWTVGIGKVTYSYNVYQADSEGGFGTYVEGEAELFRPRLEVFNDYIDLGRVFINDETDETGTRVFIGRNYNVKGISFDQIYEMAVQASKQTKTYRLTVTDGEKVFLIPLKDWLSQTYDNYLEVIGRYKVDKIAKYEFDYKVFDNLPRVAEYQFNNRDTEDVDIAEALGIELEVVSAILSKNLRTLRNSDSGTKKLEAISEKLDYFRNLHPQDKVKEIINEF